MHYLRSNDTTWVPPCVMVIHISTTSQEIDTGTRYTLNRWTLSRLDIDRKNGGPASWGIRSGATLGELLDGVRDAATGRDNIWLYLHDLPATLAITGLRQGLITQGWTIAKAPLLGTTPWLVMAKGRRRLTIVDSRSILPRRIPDIARRLGSLPVYRPAETPGGECAGERLLAETTVLVCALIRLLRWWQDGQYGRWSITGPSLGWHAMRHVIPPRKLLLDTDIEVKRQARLAIYGGRRDCTMVGVIEDVTMAELDFEAAYLTVCAHLPLPARPGMDVPTLSLSGRVLNRSDMGVIAAAHIKTDKPLYPVRICERVTYPVGEFWTTLAAPELRAALKRGHLVEVGRGRTYGRDRILKPWAEWVLGLLSDRSGSVPDIVKPLAKGWSHTVTGRFAARGVRAVPMRASGHADFYSEKVCGLPDGALGTAVTLGGIEYLVIRDQELDDTMPGLLAHVESYVRVAMGEITQRLGERCWVACDTDGITVRVRDAARRLGIIDWRTRPIPPDRVLADQIARELSAVTAPLTLRVKALSRRARIIGPQHVMTDSRRKLAGISGDGYEVAPDVWVTNLAPGLTQASSDPTRGGYVRRRMTVNLPAATAHRWVHAGGETVSPVLEVRPDGSNRLVPPDERQAPQGHGPLMEKQAPGMVALKATLT